MNDLFETPKLLPQKVRNIVDRYCRDFEDLWTYQNCKAFLKELKPLGYSFEYGLDAVPYDLKKIS